MKVRKLKSKLKFFYKYFIIPPKIWQLPRKSEVLIYDIEGSEALAPYLAKYDVTTMAVRGEYINIPCLLRAVTTFIDKNSNFYRISKIFPDIKTILLQNGYRVDWLKMKPVNDEYNVDYMLVFGTCVGKYYKAHISGKVIPVGSLKNNKVRPSNTIKSNEVLFISQYRTISKNNSPITTDINGNPIYHSEFYSSEALVLRFLAKWCYDKKKSLHIAGSQWETKTEIDYLESILGDYDWKYITKTDIYSSYKLIDTAEIVVGIDSTLIYESVARGCKTAHFSCRGFNHLIKDRKFGWPGELTDNGPFWTNDQDETQFQRIMDYLNTVSEEEWAQISREHTKQLMEFDPDNKRFITLLEQLLPKTRTTPTAVLSSIA